VPPLDLPARLAEVRQRVAAACDRAGRDPAAVRLIAVTKTFPPETARDALAAGVADIGENRVQELEEKAEALAGEPVRWHLIGPLQRNKARRAGSGPAPSSRAPSIPDERADVCCTTRMAAGRSSGSEPMSARSASRPPRDAPTTTRSWLAGAPGGESSDMGGSHGWEEERTAPEEGRAG